MHWMFLPLKRYADFSGRSRRMEYWMFTLLNVGVIILLYGLIIAGMPWTDIVAQQQATEMGQAYYGPTPEPGVTFYLGFVLMGLWVLGTFIPTIAVTVRRLHDQDKSGWLYLLNFVPIANFVLLVFMFLEGTRGPNQYGPDPKGGDHADTFA